MTKKNLNNDMLYIIIIVLLIIIAILAFFVGKNMSWGTSITPNTPSNTLPEDFNITIIDDARCFDCQTEQFTTQLTQVPSLAGVEITTVDFSDKGIQEMMKNEKITALPAIIFSHNTWLDSNMAEFLVPLPSGKYSLNIGAKFNPFAKRSDRGFLLLEKEKIEQLKQWAYIDGNSDAKISWLEYSDLECPFCAKLHTSGAPDTIKAKYNDDINIVFQHFPLSFHPKAKPGAEIAECLAEQKGAEAFYGLIKKSFKDGNSSKSYLIDNSIELWADKEKLETCLDEKKYSNKVDKQMENGTELFGITGTPGNVIINNETGEYEILSGAYPAESFEQVIDKLK